MEYKDIKTADELESWYAEKEDILEGHVRDYAVPFGNVYHLDSPGYVSEERWCDTLPSDRERSTFMALQNGVSTKEIIEHKDEFGWIDRMAMSSVADDYAECYMTQAGPDYLDEQETSGRNISLSSSATAISITAASMSALTTSRRKAIISESAGQISPST